METKIKKSKVKFKNLKKLSFKKKVKTVEEEISKVLPILEKSNLLLENQKDDNFSIFDSISYHIYKNKSKTQRLKDICKNYLQSYFLEKKKISEDLEFLENSSFLEIYEKKQNHHFFEGLNFSILANLLNRSIYLFSFFKSNKVLTASKFNAKLIPNINILVIKKEDKLIYYILKKKSDDFPDDGKRLKKLKKMKYFIEKDKFELGKNLDRYEDREIMKILRQMSDLLKIKMNSIGNLKITFDYLFKKKDNLYNDTQEIKEVFKNYCHSVQLKKNQKLPKYFYQDMILENLKSDMKKEIVFGKKTTNFFTKKREKIKKKKDFNNFFNDKTPKKALGGSVYEKNQVITNVSENKVFGFLRKFFFQQNYGFIRLENEKEDIFVHLNDFMESGINKEKLKELDKPRIRFTVTEYFGKYNNSKKATNIEIVPKENKTEI